MPHFAFVADKECLFIASSLDAAPPRVDEAEGGDVGAAVLEVLQLDEVQVQGGHEVGVVRRHDAHLEGEHSITMAIQDLI